MAFNSFPIPTTPAAEFVRGESEATPTADKIVRAPADSAVLAEGWIPDYVSGMRNRQQDDALYRILLDVLGPDAPAPYVLDQASPAYPHTDRGDFSRLGGAWQWDRNRKLVEVGADVRRDSFDPETGAYRGRLYEPERENIIPNPSLSGATVGVIGSGGSLPDDWSENFSSGGVSVEVVEVGSERGVPYFDLRISGTPSGGGPYASRSINANGSNSLTVGDAYSARSYVYGVAGSVSGFSSIVTRLASSGFGSSSAKTYDPFDVESIERAGRISENNTATDDFGTLRPFFTDLEEGVPVDITLRIGPAQFEKGPFVTSDILEQATRPPDLATYTDTGWFDREEGTMVCVATLDGFDESEDYGPGPFLSYTGSTSFYGFARISSTNSFRMGAGSGSVGSADSISIPPQGTPAVYIVGHKGSQGTVRGLINDEYNEQTKSPFEVSGGNLSSTPLKMWSGTAVTDTDVKGTTHLLFWLPKLLTQQQFLSLSTALQTLYGGS